MRLSGIQKRLRGNKVVRPFWIALCLLTCLSFVQIVPKEVCAASVSQNKITDPLALLMLFRDNTAHLQTLQADFQQEKHVALLQEKLESSGRMCVQHSSKGESLLWEYLSPSVSGFVYGGGNTSVWMRERSSLRPANNIEAQALGAMSVHVLTWVRADPDKLVKQYRFEYLPAKSAKAENEIPLPFGIRLIPRKENPFFSAIDVRFSEKLNSLHSLRLVEPHGDTTVLRFTNVVHNAPPAPFCFP